MASDNSLPSSPNPALACFSCAAACPTDLYWAGVNPMPGFENPNSAYFSVGLRAPYIPVPEWTDFANCIVASCNPRDASRFLAMAVHEISGHYTTNSASKKLIRYLVSQSYMCISRILRGGSLDEWIELERCTRFIARIVESIRFAEEMYATLIGIAALRVRSSLDTETIDKIEEEFVAINSDGSRFGDTFRHIYGQLEEISHTVPGDVLFALLDYSQSCFGLDISVDRDHFKLHIGLEYLDATSVLVRLQNAMDAVAPITGGGHEYASWTSLEWAAYLMARLPDWSGFVSAQYQTTTIVETAFDSGSRLHLGFGPTEGYPFNPIAGMQLLAGGGASAFIVEDLEAHHSMYPLWRTTIAQGKELLSIGPQAGLHALFFMPRAENIGSSVSLFSHLRRDRKADWDDSNVAERSNLTAAILYEGLRQQIACRVGVRCPLFPFAGDRCCGHHGFLRRVWEMGQAAAQEKLTPMVRWDMLSSCAAI